MSDPLAIELDRATAVKVVVSTRSPHSPGDSAKAYPAEVLTVTPDAGRATVDVLGTARNAVVPAAHRSVQVGDQVRVSFRGGYLTVTHSPARPPVKVTAPPTSTPSKPSGSTSVPGLPNLQPVYNDAVSATYSSAHTDSPAKLAAIFNSFKGVINTNATALTVLGTRDNQLRSALATAALRSLDERLDAVERALGQSVDLATGTRTAVNSLRSATNADRLTK